MVGPVRGGIEGPRQHLRQDPGGQELGRGHQEQDADEQQGPPPDVGPEDELDHRQVGHDQGPDDPEGDPDGPEEVPGPGPEAQEEEGRQQVQQDAEGARDPVLGLPEAPRRMGHHALADAVGVRHPRHPHRDEAVHLTEQVHSLDDRGPVDLEAAPVVVQLDPGDPGDESVGDARGDLAQDQGVLAVLAPPLEQVQVAGEEFIHQAGDVRRVVLEVAVQGGDQVPAGGVEARLHGGGLAEVAPQADDPHMGPVAGGGLAQPRRGPVAAAVVHADQLPGPAVARQALMHTGQERGNIVRLLVEGDDDGQAGAIGLGGAHGGGPGGAGGWFAAAGKLNAALGKDQPGTGHIAQMNANKRQRNNRLA